jgi:hypothetical protein
MSPELKSQITGRPLPKPLPSLSTLLGQVAERFAVLGKMGNATDNQARLALQGIVSMLDLDIAAKKLATDIAAKKAEAANPALLAAARAQREADTAKADAAQKQREADAAKAAKDLQDKQLAEVAAAQKAQQDAEALEAQKVADALEAVQASLTSTT